MPQSTARSLGTILVLLLAVAQAAAQTPEIEGLKKRLGELDARQRAVGEELRQQRARVTAYLTFLDQSLQMRQFLGEATPAVAQESLVTTRARLFDQSFTAADWNALLAQHQATAGRYFDRIESTVARTTRWPADRTAAEWRALAQRELVEARRGYAQKIAQGIDVEPELRKANRALAWASGHREILRELEHFAATRQRVAVVVDQIPAGRLPQGPAALGTTLVEGYALFNQGHYQQALAAFDAALRTDPRSAEALIGRGRSLNGLGDLDGARRAYEAAVHSEPNRQHVRAWIAELWLSSGEYRRAETLLQEELRLFPSSAWAHSFMGTVRLLEGRQGEASQSMGAAMRLDPAVATQRYSNATYLGGLGQDRRALIEFSSVLALDPGMWAAYYGVGFHAARLGATAQAIQAYEAYLQRDQSSEFTQRARAEVARLKGETPPGVGGQCPPGSVAILGVCASIQIQPSR